MIEIKAWYWLVFGMLLILLELVVPSFTIIWFGCGALAVALLLWWFAELALSWQLFAWTLSSIVMTVVWFRVVKPRMTNKTTAGIPLEAVLGESGLVIQPPRPDQRGVAKFTTPLLGAEKWPFICEESVGVGDRITVISVSGNTLLVKKG